jgi:hypothetical protein
MDGTMSTVKRQSANVVEYIAREAVRRYGAVEPRLPEKLQRNVRRNFHVTVPRDEILLLVQHYKAVYAFAAAILPNHLGPQTGYYVEATDVQQAAFAAALKKRYPRESQAVRDIVIWYAVYYEYLS